MGGPAWISCCSGRGYAGYFRGWDRRVRRESSRGGVDRPCFAAAGFIAVQPLFWTFPTNYLGGVAAAGGIALINAIGALGGFITPSVKA